MYLIPRFIFETTACCPSCYWHGRELIVMGEAIEHVSFCVLSKRAHLKRENVMDQCSACLWSCADIKEIPRTPHEYLPLRGELSLPTLLLLERSNSLNGLYFFSYNSHDIRYNRVMIVVTGTKLKYLIQYILFISNAVAGLHRLVKERDILNGWLQYPLV